MSRLELSLLGPFRATLDGEPVTGFESNKVRALLAYLAVEANAPHHRGALAGLLWPGWPERSARKNLSNALSNLRGILGDRTPIAARDASPPFLLVTRETIQFDRASDHWLDVDAFEERAQTAPPDPSVVHQLEEAMALYGGEFLEGFSVGDSSAFEDWALLVRERLHRQALDSLDWLSMHCARQGEYERACEHARRQVELEPSEEGAHRQLMRLYAWLGQRAAALRQYRECVRILEEELGVAPGVETLQLYQRISEDRELPPAADHLAEGAPSRAFPPRHNLPAQLIPMVGRAEMLAGILARLRDPDCRLLTLVGPGGSGKTRLAIEAAKRVLADDGDGGFPDGVHFVPLAPLRSPDEIAFTIAQAVGLSGAQGIAPREQLLDYLQERRVLLVLDNLEHLLSPPVEGSDGRGRSPAPVVPRTGDTANLVAEVLRSAPELKVLATSRARLNLRGEQLYPVLGMDVPPPRAAPRRGAGEEGQPTPLTRDTAHYSAVQLYLQGARRVCPGYQPEGDDLEHIAQVCRLAGGMPLAILLAAAWMRILSPGEIAAEMSGRLDHGLDFLATDWHGVPERQRSMRAVFDHSYNLLSERQREILRGLSVFRGSFAHAAAAEVAGATLRDLLALVDMSLVQRTSTGRYALHELVRQYAAQKLVGSPKGAAAARDRHAAYYAAALARWVAEYQGPRQLAALVELEGEMADVRTAWAWMAEHRQAEWLDRALDAVFLLSDRLRRYDEVEAMLLAAERSLASATEQTPVPPLQLRVLSRVLAGRSFVLYHARSDSRRARDLAERSLAFLYRPELADQDVRREEAFASMFRALAGVDSYAQAARLCQRSVALYQELGQRWWMAYALNRWGHAARSHREWEEAKRLHEQSDALLRELGLVDYRMATLYSLTASAIQLGQFREAEQVARENLALRRGLSEADAAMGLVFLGWPVHLLGRFAEARSVLEKGLAVCHRLELRRDRLWNSARWIEAGAHLAQYKEAKQECLAYINECRKLGQPELIATALALSGWIDLATRSYQEAWQRGQESLALATELWQEFSAALVLGHAARGLGQPDRARSFLCRALQAACQLRVVPQLLDALPAVALLLLDQGQAERAVEVYALARRFPYVANSCWFEDVVGRHIDGAVATLPEDVVSRAWARGRSRDLWATAQALLAELR